MAMSGFLVAVSSWSHILQCIVIVQSFLRLLKLHKLAVCKLDLSRGGLARCHSVLDHGLNLRHNTPLNSVFSLTVTLYRGCTMGKLRSSDTVNTSGSR